MKLFQPKQSVFFILFKDVSQNLTAISELFAEFIEKFSDFENFANKAKIIEHQADEKTHEIVSRLNKTFITPFDREDIYSLAHELDDIVDLIENAIHNIYLYKITENNPAFSEFAKIIKQDAAYTEKLIACLEKHKNTQELTDTKIIMHELEDKGDVIFAESISRLFSNGKDPITVIKEKDILEDLENIVDKYQKVSDIIEGLLVKSS
jgi:predicted phosphate transport protein (TIGR00153 family)